MEVFGLLADGFAVALQPINLLLAFLGVVVGTVVGMLPGIGPINAIAILIPITFAAGVRPESALILLAGIYYGSQYGNSISTILINVPGTASSVVTALDGYEMTRQGRAGPALAISAIASFFGGTISIVGLMLLGPLLARWAIRFGPAEYFALMVFAFAALSSLAGSNAAKGIIATALGLLLGTVGLDPNSAIPRFTFGQIRLLDGMDFVVVTIGLFAVSEVIGVLEETERGHVVTERIGRVMASAKETLASLGSMIRGSVIGFLIGVLPGAGGTIGSFMAYAAEKQWLGRRGRLGRGDIRGVAAPEAANNAAANGAMIPMLTLGVPGSGTTAVMLGALLGMNVTPGPLLIEQRPEIFWGLVASMYIGNLLLLILNLPLVGLFIRVLLLPRWILMPCVAALSFVAVYAVNTSAFDLLLVTGFGVLGWTLRKLDVPLAPIILGVVLGPLMEKNLRRAMALGGGEWSILFSSTIALALYALAALSLVAPRVAARFSRGRSIDESAEID